MKINKILKRVCAFTLAIATVTTSMIYAPQVVNAALNQYYVKFIDNITKHEDRTATLLEGETIKTTAQMPDNYKYLNPPFEVKGFSDATSPISVTPEGNITAKPISAGQMTLYTVEPVFSAFLTESDTGVATCLTEDSNGDPKRRVVAMDAEVLNNRDISITEQSTITMTVSEDQTDPKGGYLNFDNTNGVEATGGLSEFDKGIATFIKRDGDYITVRIDNKSGKKLELKLKADFPQVMKKNTTFKLTFTLQTLGDLQLTVISKQKAVDTIATDIGAAANFNDFIKLEYGDTQHTISNKFDVVHTEKRYNNKNGFKIDWKWAPDKPEDNDVVKIKGDPADNNWLVTSYPKLENVTGKLQAKVSWEKDGNTVISTVQSSVPITILGTGTYPKLNPIYKYTGNLSSGGKPVELDVVPREMDVNDGHYEDYEGKVPYKFTGELMYGTGLGKAENIKIEFNNAYSGKVDIFIDNSTSLYKPGALLPAPNEGTREGTRAITVRATQQGLCVMKVYFYNKSGQAYNNSPKVYNIDIQDTSPCKDASLKSLKMIGNSVNDEKYQNRFNEIYPNGEIDYGFNVDENQRIYNVTVPWAVESVNLTPIYKVLGNTKTNPITVISGSITQENITGTGKNGKLPDDTHGVATTDNITLTEDETKVVYINGVAEDDTTFSRYELHITRAPKSDIASLKSLTITSKKDGKKQEHELTPTFDPITYTYNLSLPYEYAYSKDKIKNIDTKIEASAFGDWGEKPEISGDCVYTCNIFERILNMIFRRSSSDLRLTYQEDETTGEIKSVNTVNITVKSEDGTKTATYTVNINIEDPSENNQLSVFNIYEKGSTTPMEFYNNQKFVKDDVAYIRDYYLEIPYKTDELRFELQPDDEKAQNIRIIHPSIYGFGDDNKPQIKEYKKKGSPIIVKVKVPPLKDYLENKTFDYQFEVQAESNKWTGESSEPYTLHITRLEPNKDSRLTSMTVVNTADNNPVDTFRYVQQKKDYTFEVPFTTEEVVISPVASEPELSTVTVNGTEISKTMTGKIVKLGAGKTTTVKVIVLPEAGTSYQTVYTLNINRKAPSTEARLQKLNVIGGEDMTPEPFVPSTTRYSVSIPNGTESYTISAIPVDEKATITINGQEVENGSPSKPIVSADPYSKIEIVVTAEDGKTKKVYTLSVKDYNLIKKSDNATLSDLKIEYADLAPKFKPNIDEYELYVKPDTTHLDITPVRANRGSTVEVFVGSKKLTSYGGVYSNSLFTNKTTFTIHVVAEDEITEKIYTVNVFKNDKKKQGAFRPITDDMVDYEGENPIVIDITNYAVIDASVFNTLKTDYPEKSILFKGNDYQLRISGKDIKDLVPHTEQFDLYFSFTTPEEQYIQDLLWENYYDWDLEPVYLYFDDHGPLPGKMILTVNLGHEYKNDQLFWNYYNGERKRIDYYGYVNSNAKGTFTVPITHMSTYMVVPEKIRVAEDKTGSGFGTVDGSSSNSQGSENANKETTGDKGIPKTRVDCEISNIKSSGGLK